VSYIDNDLAFALSDFDASEVQVAGITTNGHLEETDAVSTDENGDPIQRRLTVVRVRRSDFEDGLGRLVISRGDVAMIGGVAYTVSEFLVGDPNALVSTGRDGRELVIRVRRA